MISRTPGLKEYCGYWQVPLIHDNIAVNHSEHSRAMWAFSVSGRTQEEDMVSSNSTNASYLCGWRNWFTVEPMTDILVTLYSIILFFFLLLFFLLCLFNYLIIPEQFTVKAQESLIPT